jgi:beta-glucosidase-like glycosyl hydrolase
MIPYNYPEFTTDLTSLVKNNAIPMSRVDDAVRRILRVKFTMGLFEQPYADPTLANQVGAKVIPLSLSTSLLTPLSIPS